MDRLRPQKFNKSQSSGHTSTAEKTQQSQGLFQSRPRKKTEKQLLLFVLLSSRFLLGKREVSEGRKVVVFVKAISIEICKLSPN